MPGGGRALLSPLEHIAHAAWCLWTARLTQATSRALLTRTCGYYPSTKKTPSQVAKVSYVELMCRVAHLAAPRCYGRVLWATPRHMCAGRWKGDKSTYQRTCAQPPGSNRAHRPAPNRSYLLEGFTGLDGPKRQDSGGLKERYQTQCPPYLQASLPGCVASIVAQSIDYHKTYITNGKDSPSSFVPLWPTPKVRYRLHRKTSRQAHHRYLNHPRFGLRWQRYTPPRL